MTNSFKIGDKVEFLGDYPEDPDFRRARKGDKATVTTFPSGDLVTVKLDRNGSQESVFPRRLKLVKRELKVGDKVRFVGDNADWKGVEGIIEKLKNPDGGIYNHQVRLLTEPRNKKNYFMANVGDVARLRPENVELVEVDPYTFANVQVGDKIRRTYTFDKGATEVREGVVGRVFNSYKATDKSGELALAYDTDDTNVAVTLELLERPEPEDVWKDAKAGDVFLREDAQGGTTTVARNGKGWLVTYGNERKVRYQQFEVKDAWIIFAGGYKVSKL